MSTSTATQSALPALGYDGLKPYAFLSITLVLISYLLYQWALPKPLPGIPYNVDSARKIMGDIPDLLKGAGQPDKTYISYIQKQVAMHKSPIIQLFLKPLGRPMVVISDFRESQDILMRRKEFDRSPFMGELFHGVAPEHHIMKPTNSAWKAQRRLLQDLMSPPFLNNVAGPVIHSSVQNLIRLWSLKSDIAGQRPFSATEDIYSAALDAVFGFAFGENFEYNATSPTVKLLEELGAHDVEELRRTGNASDDSAVEFPKTPRDKAVRSTSDLALALEDINGKPLSQVWWKYVTARTARTRQALKDRDEYIYDELKKAVTRMENKDLTVRSAVDHMIQRETILAQKDGRAPKYLSPVMADETFGFVIAGHETTSTTALWGMKLLADNPQPQAKLRRCLQATHAEALRTGRSPSIDEITSTNIPFLDAVMEEILRCGGTVPGVDRVALSDTQVFGYHIPKGTSVLMSSMGPGMLEPGFDVDENRRSESSRHAKTEGRDRAWDNDDIGKFKPERWLVPAPGRTEIDDDSCFDSAAGPLLVFGLGIRGCYGKRLAYLELRTLLTMIIWNFELLRCPDELSGYAAIAGVTYRPKQCYARLRKVSNS